MNAWSVKEDSTYKTIIVERALRSTTVITITVPEIDTAESVLITI